MERPDILHRLDEVERVANGSKFIRFLTRPLSYLEALIFNRLIYPIRKQPIQRTVRTCYGLPFTVALPAGTDIFLTGGKTHASEIKLARFLVRHLREGETYVDVGAHYGYFAGLAKALKARVTAYEPAPSTYRLLEQNLASTRTKLNQKGLADVEEELTFYQFPARFSEYNSLDVEQYRNESWLAAYPPEAVSVPISTLDIEFENPPRFLKIDVEGAEDRVILGGARNLRQGKTVIVMEYLPLASSNGSHRRALQQLNEWGYATYSLDTVGNLISRDNPDEWMQQSGLDSVNLVFCTEVPVAVA